jgi:hypothetical protein
VDIEWSLDLSDMDRIRTDAHRITAHWVRRIFTGWTFGLGGIVGARIYRKDLQAPKDSPFIFDIWRSTGEYHEGKPVLRVEFELKRTALVEYNMRTVDSLFARQAGAWKSLCATWLHLEPSTTRQKTRQYDPIWEYLMNRGFAPSTLAKLDRAKRSAQNSMDASRTIAQAKGALSSLAAIACASDSGCDLDALSDWRKWIPPAAKLLPADMRAELVLKMQAIALDVQRKAQARGVVTLTDPEALRSLPPSSQLPAKHAMTGDGDTAPAPSESNSISCAESPPIGALPL